MSRTPAPWLPSSTTTKPWPRSAIRNCRSIRTTTSRPDCCQRGAGAVFSFELEGGRDAGRTFIESLKLFSHLANVGDAKSLVIHPASTTHHRMDAEALAAAGIGEGLVRLSIGLEDPKDLIGDLGRALRRASRPPRPAAAKAREASSS